MRKLQKTAKKLLASAFALSLVVTSLPVVSTTALANEETTKTTTACKDLVKRIGDVDNPDGGSPYALCLYCNDETGTAFTFCGHDVPNILKFLIDVSDTFDYGMQFSFSASLKENIDFPDADVLVRGAVGSGKEYYDVTNYGDIVYTDAAGEAHTFTRMKDIEDYLIQNYPVTILDIHEIKEEDLPWATTSATTTSVTTTTTTTTVTTGTTKEERDMTTSIGRVINPEGSDYETSALFLHYNEKTETAFVFCGHDVSPYMKALIVEPTAFDGTVVYSEACMKYFSFPDADIEVWKSGKENSYCVENHGTIIYTDENGKKHTFTCIKDAEDYVMQNYPAIPLDIHKIDESMFLNNSILFDSMESVKEYAIQNFPVLDTGKTDVTTNVPSNILIGDVTMDGKVDLLDAIYLNKICSNIIFPTDMQRIAGDCNADGTVNDVDVDRLMDFCIGLQKKLPVTD